MSDCNLRRRPPEEAHPCCAEEILGLRDHVAELERQRDDLQARNAELFEQRRSMERERDSAESGCIQAEARAVAAERARDQEREELRDLRTVAHRAQEVMDLIYPPDVWLPDSTSPAACPKCGFGLLPNGYCGVCRFLTGAAPRDLGPTAQPPSAPELLRIPDVNADTTGMRCPDPLPPVASPPAAAAPAGTRLDDQEVRDMVREIKEHGHPIVHLWDSTAIAAAIEELAANREQLRRYTGPARGNEPVAERDAILAQWEEGRAQLRDAMARSEALQRTAEERVRALEVKLQRAHEESAAMIGERLRRDFERIYEEEAPTMDMHEQALARRFVDSIAVLARQTAALLGPQTAAPTEKESDHG